MGKKNEKEEKQVQDAASEEKMDKKETVDTNQDIENLKKDDDLDYKKHYYKHCYKVKYIKFN